MSRYLLRRWLLGPLAGCVVLPMCGCQKSVAPVSGRVTLNGQAVVGAVVTFQPRGTKDAPQPAGAGSVGHTDSKGRFSLRLVESDQPGAIIGEHSVTISTAYGGSEEAPAKARPLPKAWLDGSKRFKVPPGGVGDANFEINALGTR